MIYLISGKDQVVEVLKGFINMIKIQFHYTIKRLITDNGTGFVNQYVYQLFEIMGYYIRKLAHILTSTDGVVEKRHRTLLETARALAFTGGLPLRFFPYSLLTTAWILNRTPSRVLDWCSHEILFKEQPNFSILRPFRCIAFVVDLTPSRGKFDFRSFKCIFIECDVFHKRYI